MPDNSIVLYTLLTYALLALAIGIWAGRRTHDNADFFLGGRGLGPWVAALSASASSSSAWTLLGVSGAAYAWGLPALWLFPATLSGFLLNWYVIAPRLRRLSAANGALTLSEFIIPQEFGERRRLILRVAAAIIVFCFIFYVASQFEGAGKAFSAYFGWPRELGIVLGALIVLFYMLVGGFWAVSVTDTLQGLLMAGAAVVLPVAAVAALGGLDQVLPLLHTTATPAGASSPVYSGVLGIAFVAGTLGIGLGYPGQPHVVNRFMALNDEHSLRQARVIAIGWAVVVYTGMLVLGLCARGLDGSIADSEQVLFEMAGHLLPPVLAAIVLAAVISAIMSTADSQLLVAASAVSYDWNLASGRKTTQQDQSATALKHSRWVVVLLCILAGALALLVREAIFSRVLFAWHAIGSAFGPLLLLRVFEYRISANATLAALLSGFLLTVILYWLPDTPGDWAERLLPLLVSAIIAWRGCTPKDIS